MSSASQGEFVATVIAGKGATLAPDLLKKLSELVQATRTEGLAEGVAADLFCARGAEPDIYAKLKGTIKNQPFDVLVQQASTRHKKLLIADMESTIIEQEMLDELAGEIGLRDKVEAITRRAMNGELDFATALRERVVLLKDQPASILDAVGKRITFMPGAKALISAMRAQGAQCWLVSGGFDYFVEPVAATLTFDRGYANRLIIKDGKLTGDVLEPLLDKNTKKAVLLNAAQEFGLDLSACMVVGDGANDIPMLVACNEGGGFGVAYHAKTNVRDVIPHQINHSDLIALLYAQGYKQEEIISSSQM